MKASVKDYEIRIEAENVGEDHLLDMLYQWYDTNTKQAVLKLVSSDGNSIEITL
jgi:hypothetical protein